ncbi:unnamed protein product [Phytomonas sp. EM1]|nr:unnamed protein product [Phytomonas sp. EM1]|eukprot:CCW59690.1 unnamed protein product [Phytomonas sp. isolate EM1]
MQASDIECLAQMLDKNHAFTRPRGQTVGYSLQDTTEGNSSAAAPPSQIQLPSTVVDKQLRLPKPSHSKQNKTGQGEDSATDANRFVGNEIWTQEELRVILESNASQVSPPGAFPAVRCAPAVNRGNSKLLGQTATAPLTPQCDQEEPLYEVLYLQHLTAEDVYLGMDFTRDSSSLASDGIVVKIKMPKLSVPPESIELHVEPLQLILSTPEYFLRAELPQQVQKGMANAKWDATKKTLTVQLISEASKKVKLL